MYCLVLTGSSRPNLVSVPRSILVYVVRDPQERNLTRLMLFWTLAETGFVLLVSCNPVGLVRQYLGLLKKDSKGANTTEGTGSLHESGIDSELNNLKLQEIELTATSKSQESENMSSHDFGEILEVGFYKDATPTLTKDEG